MGKIISAAVLAGGKGQRMKGINKPALVLDGETIMSRILNTISDLFHEIIIVSNDKTEVLEFQNCVIVSDIYRDKGPIGGIHAALHHTRSDAVFVFAGDMPLLNRNLISRQVSAFNAGTYDILVPRIEVSIEPLHSIYSRKIVDKLEEFILSGSGNAIRDFYIKVNTGYLDIIEGEKEAFSNINNHADLIEIERIIRKKGAGEI
jgi:molybdopterin-guanine dinucleotide biosynthesis protein A